MGSPLVLDVADVLRSHATLRTVTQHGTTGQHIGLDMVGFASDADLTVDATLTPLGGAVLIDATISGELTGQCSRCLAPIAADYDLRVSAVFSEDPDFVVGDAADDDTDTEDVGRIERGYADLTPVVIDEAGLVLPFNPVCEDYGLDCDNVNVPPPDGVSGEEETTHHIDPRWAGLEKFT